MTVPVPVVVRFLLVAWLLLPRPHVSVTVCEIGFRYSPHPIARPCQRARACPLRAHCAEPRFRIPPTALVPMSSSMTSRLRHPFDRAGRVLRFGCLSLGGPCTAAKAKTRDLWCRHLECCFGRFGSNVPAEAQGTLDQCECSCREVSEEMWQVRLPDVQRLSEHQLQARHCEP